MTAASSPAWPDGPGVLHLPDGRTVRGRGLRHPLPPGPAPDLGLYLLRRPPSPDRVAGALATGSGTDLEGRRPPSPDRVAGAPAPEGGAAGGHRRPRPGLAVQAEPLGGVPWEARWIRWPDFGLPADRAGALAELRRAWDRAAGERVEVACWGGVGRTGTALAALAVLSGIDPVEAVAWVRARYHRRAAETPFQRRWVASLPRERPTGSS